jgi:hypothetical protein
MEPAAMYKRKVAGSAVDRFEPEIHQLLRSPNDAGGVIVRGSAGRGG